MNKSAIELEKLFRSMHYYCIRWNPRTRGPEYVNVMEAFDGATLYEAVNVYKSVTNYTELDRWVKLVLRMKYHLKTEAEINVCGVVSPSIEDLNRIDVYDQIVPNINMFVDIINKATGLNYPKEEVNKENMIIPIADEM